jgi:bifunctional DNase/RNase
MKSKEQCYYVTVQKSYEVTYQLYAYSFEDALMKWEQEGNDVDTQPSDSVVLSVRVD